MLDVYDINHIKTGKIIQRGETLLENEFQLAACIVILNQNREFLVTQRHPKKQMGLYWEIPGGAVESNEKSEAAAIRELYEEIGIAVNESELEFIGTTVYTPFQLLIDSYLIIKKVKLSTLVLQEEEVIATRFMHFNEITKYRFQGEFTPFDYEVCKNIQQKITDKGKKYYEEKGIGHECF